MGDVDRAFREAGSGERAADLRQMAPDLHDGRRAGGSEPGGKRRLGQRAGQTSNASERAQSGRPEAAAQAVSDVTPGTITLGCAAARRAWRYMKEP